MPSGPRPLRRRLHEAFASLRGRTLGPESAVGEAAAEDLLRCPRCGDGSLCPMGWETQGELAWWISLRCGNCGVWVEAVVSNRHAATLDAALDRQLDVIRRAAYALEVERTQRMRAEVDAFIAALQCDRIHPVDFN